MNEITNTKDYISFLNDIKKDIQTSRIRAHLAVNKELILLYWRIGNGILNKQEFLGWGSRVIDQLSCDLIPSCNHKLGCCSSLTYTYKHRSSLLLFYRLQLGMKTEFPNTIGFSKQNLWYMHQFAGEIPWGHNIAMQKYLPSAGQFQHILDTTNHMQD